MTRPSGPLVARRVADTQVFLGRNALSLALRWIRGACGALQVRHACVWSETTTRRFASWYKPSGLYIVGRNGYPVHAKVYLVNDSYVVLSSQNRGPNPSFEHAVVVRDKELYDEMYAAIVEISEANIDHRPLISAADKRARECNNKHWIARVARIRCFYDCRGFLNPRDVRDLRVYAASEGEAR